MITVLDFYADYCKPCQQILKILPRLEKEVEGIAVVEKVNVDERTDLVDQYDIRGVPTFVLLKEGVEVERFQGVIPLAQLELEIKKHA